MVGPILVSVLFVTNHSHPIDRVVNESVVMEFTTLRNAALGWEASACIPGLLLFLLFY